MKWLNRLTGQLPAGSIKFVSPAKLERLLACEFEEFADESLEARQWEACLEQVEAWLGRFSQDEEAEGADGSPGFLLEDIWQGVLTIGIEFNDPTLLTKPVLEGLAKISAKCDPAIEFGITFLVPGKNPDNLDMLTLVIRKGIVYAPNLPEVKKAVQAVG